MTNLPQLGFGIGLRAPHYNDFLHGMPPVDWLEIITENFIDAHGGYWDFLAHLRTKYPMVLHGVSLSVGGVDPISDIYLKKLRKLAEFLQAAWISDHLCFTQNKGENTHDLLPIPYTEESLKHLTQRISAIQNELGQRLILENPSSYFTYSASTLTEWQFIQALCEETQCGILLDVNNVYVSAFNHDFDPYTYIDTLSKEFIIQIHLAGHQDRGTYLFDTHDARVTDPVWALYQYTLEKKGPISTMIEWDSEIPPLPVILEELNRARALCETTR